MKYPYFRGLEADRCRRNHHWKLRHDAVPGRQGKLHPQGDFRNAGQGNHRPLQHIGYPWQQSLFWNELPKDWKRADEPGFCTSDTYFIDPYKQYPVMMCGQRVILTNGNLAAALSSLPEKKREIIYLYFLGHYTQQEIGEMYGRCRSTTGYQIRRTLQLLHKCSCVIK